MRSTLGLIVTACAFAIAVPGSRSVGQQQTNTGVGITPGLQAAPAPAGPPHLFGDWGGLRRYLDSFGVNLSVDYTTETAANVAGGLRRGVDYAHQIGVQVDVDWEKLASIPGFSTHLAVVNRAGRNLSSDYIGDRVLQAQKSMVPALTWPCTMSGSTVSKSCSTTASMPCSGGFFLAWISQPRRFTATS